MACSPIFNALRITASLATALLLATLVRAAPQLDMRDGHGHHHGAPLLELNETQVLEGHAPTPPSYWSVDVDVGGPNTHSGLMALHVVFMCLAFFVALPACKYSTRLSPECLYLTTCCQRSPCGR